MRAVPSLTSACGKSPQSVARIGLESNAGQAWWAGRGGRGGFAGIDATSRAASTIMGFHVPGGRRQVPWLLLALAALMFGLYNLFIKLSAGHIHAVVGAVALQLVAALVGLGLLVWLRLADGLAIEADARGWSHAVAAGIAIGLVEILTFVVYGRGVAVSVGNPLILGGAVLVTAAAGVLWLRESLSALQVLAIGLVAAGLMLLAWEGRG